MWMSPCQLGSSHWTSAEYTETAGEVPALQSHPPARPPQQQPELVRCAQHRGPLCQLEAGTLHLFKNGWF